MCIIYPNNFWFVKFRGIMDLRLSDIHVVQISFASCQANALWGWGWTAPLHMSTSSSCGEVPQVGASKGRVRAWNCVCVLWEWNSRFWVKICCPGITEIWGRPCMKQGGDVRMARVCWHSMRKMKKCGRGGREMGLQGPRDLNNYRASLGSIPCDSRGEVGRRMLLV